jgi:hypothetical protein
LTISNTNRLKVIVIGGGGKLFELGVVMHPFENFMCVYMDSVLRGRASAAGLKMRIRRHEIIFGMEDRRQYKGFYHIYDVKIVCTKAGNIRIHYQNYLSIDGLNYPSMFVDLKNADLENKFKTFPTTPTDEDWLKLLKILKALKHDFYTEAWLESRVCRHIKETKRTEVKKNIPVVEVPQLPLPEPHDFMGRVQFALSGRPRNF